MNLADIRHVAQRLFADVRLELGLPSRLAERARAMDPLLVRTLDGRPSFWLVPLAMNERLLGFLRLDLDGGLVSYGRYGQAEELSGFPLLSYLSQERAATEIAASFRLGAGEIDPPTLVHDGPEERIAWLSRSTSPGCEGLLLFWTFGTAYSRPEENQPGYGMV